jgi:hypothetical protein
MTPLSVHDQIQKFRALINQDKSKATSIHGDIERRQQRTTKDGNTSMNLLFFRIQMLVSMPSTLLGATFCFSLPTITWLLGGQPRFLFIFNR